MRHLKPLTIVMLGGLLTAATFSVAFLMTTADFRNLRGFSIAFSTGGVFGVLMFAPMALGEKFRGHIRRWLERHGARMQRWVALLMAISVGYSFASVRHQTFDAWTYVALGLVFLAAVFGVVVGGAIEDRQSAA